MSLTFKQYLEEKVVTPWKADTLEVEKAIQLLNKHCKSGISAIQNNFLLYRGFSKTALGPVALIDSSNSERTSNDYSNLYQLMMDSSEELIDYPSRSNSLICTAELRDARYYTTSRNSAYVVFPFDGTTITGSGERDFTQRYIRPSVIQGTTISDFDSFMGDFLSKLGIKSKKYLKADIPRINAKIKSLDPYLVLSIFVREVILDADEIFKHIRDYEDRFNKSAEKTELTPKGTKLLKIFQSEFPFEDLSTEIFIPKILGLKKAVFGTSKLEGEIWFSGQAIVIREDLFSEILASMVEKNIIKKNPRSFRN